MNKKRQLQTAKSALQTAEATIAKQKQDLEQSEMLRKCKTQALDNLSINESAVARLQAENDRLSDLIDRQGLLLMPPAWLLTSPCWHKVWGPEEHCYLICWSHQSLALHAHHCKAF